MHDLKIKYCKWVFVTEFCGHPVVTELINIFSVDGLLNSIKVKCYDLPYCIDQLSHSNFYNISACLTETMLSAFATANCEQH